MNRSHDADESRTREDRSASPDTPTDVPGLDDEGAADVAKKSRKRAESKAEAADEQPLSAPTIYEVIAAQGVEEMERPLNSLWWSGVAAGMGISLSLFMMAALRVSLEGVPGALALEKFGYCLGFLIVILSRLQLFTENTITPILPALRERTVARFRSVVRLWSVVFVANMLGTFIAALMAWGLPVAAPEHVDAMLEISRHFAERPPTEVFFSAIPAGFLVAVMVWMLPSSESFEFWTISVITFAIAITGTSHVVVGSTELFTVLLHGETGITDAALRLFMAGTGNIVGGTGLFAVLAYAQVSEEI